MSSSGGLSRSDWVADRLAVSFERGGLLITEAELGTEFFDLRSGLAGELMQSFVNYGQKLAIVLDGLDDKSPRFQELVHEHLNHPHVRFVRSVQEGQHWLDA